ncbi:hypothetical protein GmHk_01G001163 [Glycine max]|nr:hypothetical protein GmHk_01G001163 [Glycine max]
MGSWTSHIELRVTFVRRTKRGTCKTNDSDAQEDTHHGASDNESSSSERLRVSCRVGGGASCLYGRVQPSVASPTGESIPITVILPPSTSRGPRNNGGGDVRMSPRKMGKIGEVKNL